MRAVLALILFAPATAEAHFQLLNPPSWTNENFLGDPQKDSPCGGEGGTATGVVTQYMAGETITLMWDETIYHPGHWRIALSDNRGDFFDPTISLDGNQVSTGATITDPPVAPIIIDNLFPRTGGGSTQTFTYDITLPNEPCANCTIQVIQFMLGHGPPNYIYYHCADIEILAGPVPDAGSPEDASPADGPVMDTGNPVDTGVAVDTGVQQDAAPADTGTPRDVGSVVPDSGVGEEEDDGCTCVTPREQASSLGLLLLLGLVLGVRRWRFSHS